MKLPGRFRSLASIATLRRPWIVPVAAAGLVAAVLGGWWLARAPRSSSPVAGSGEAAPGAAARAAARAAVDPLAYVAARADTTRSGNLDQLIQAYGAWASRPDAIDARREIVRILAGHSSVQVAVEALLRAVETDQTPRRHDPLWGELVRHLAARWDAETFPYGRDLVQLETRDRSRELILESLANLRPEKLTAQQRTYLASDFIDAYPSLRPDQKPAVDRALHALVGDDVVDILAGRGLTEGDNRLKVAAARQRALEEVKRNPVREAPAEE